jgi:hypothetical protein
MKIFCPRFAWTPTPAGRVPGLSNIQEIKGLRGGVLMHAAQGTPKIDAEIDKKDHLWVKTYYFLSFLGRVRVS